MATTQTTPAAPPPAAIEARGLTKRYGGLAVVRDVTLRLPQGSRTALLGANGAGKTTLLGLLATLLTPSEGEATVAGHPVHARAAALRRSIGVLAHRPMLYEEMTPLENLDLFARLYEVADADTRIEELLRAVGIWARRHEAVAVLSRGAHQRLALARALLHRPSVLLADEPETGLDPDGVVMLDELALAAPGLTVLAATHRVDRVPSWATGLVRLDRGRLVEDTASVAGLGAEAR
ncbi:MAG: ABC transporter ATP-binding protein [Dehalococcoidia bacterium]